MAQMFLRLLRTLVMITTDLEWLNDIEIFAEVLERRAATRGYEPFRPECRADIEYMHKAAQHLKMVTEAYTNLVTNLDSLYEKHNELQEAAAEAIKIAKNQLDLQKLKPGSEHGSPRK